MTMARITVLGMVAALAASAQEPSKLVFVEQGVPAHVVERGAPWSRGDGFLECSGQNNYLLADKMLGRGDFKIQVRLSLAQLEHTAASFSIGGRSHFGFDTGQGKMFVQGPLLGGRTRDVPKAKGTIKPGEPFLFEVVRKDKTLTFRIDGVDLHEEPYTKVWFGPFGLRPWRSTMRVFDFSAEGRFRELSRPRTQPDGYSIPILDLSAEKWRQVVVESTPGQYLGHPTTVLLADNKTILVTYPLGHGGPSAVLKRSTDGGLTWSDRLPVPDNWSTATNCPCLHQLTGPDGVERLFVIEGNGAMRQSVSLDNGVTWTPFEPNGLNCVVAPITIVPLSGGRHLAHYQQRVDTDGERVLTIWQSISLDGGLTWEPERMVAEYAGADICEPATIRSPDGKQLASLMRENARYYNSMLITSDDEGETWSEPVELPASLTGDRHLPRYAPDGRIVMPMRDTAHKSPTRGDFVAWVGTYDDIVNLREGQYRVRLLNSPTKMDLGYPGLELLPDGTFVATTYAVLNEGEKHSVVSVRFTMDDLDKKAAELPRQEPVFISGEDGYDTYRIPALIVSPNGAVLAFCEGRKNSGSDHGDIDLVLKRSLDGGETWQPMQVVWDDSDHTVGNPAPVVDQSTGVIWLPFCLDNDRVFVTTSSDDGVTWTAPTEITADVKPGDWSWYATGPVHGIQLIDGRLLIPCDHRLKGSSTMYSHVIASDDHGASWQLGGLLTENTDECTVAELDDGSIYLNMRSYEGKNRRAVARSTDRGATWSEVTLDQTLVEPVCQASVIRTGHGDQLLFSNPASTNRERMTVRVSNDGGRTWNDGNVLTYGPAAYSDLALTPDGKVLCLYERGTEKPYETITLAAFDLDWLTGEL